MNAFAAGLADQGLRVVRFEFPYMAERRQTGKRRPPDREPVLRQTWLEVIAAVDARPLIIGGKSMGGRIASLIADEADVAGLVCLGYPFHPTRKPDQLRVEHLRAIRTPTLILQGERDAFGSADEVPGYGLSGKLLLTRVFPSRKYVSRPTRQDRESVHDVWPCLTRSHERAGVGPSLGVLLTANHLRHSIGLAHRTAPPHRGSGD